MSIPVRLEDLASTLAGYGAGYLLTASAEGRVKAVTVEVAEVADGTVRVVWGSGGTARNLDRNPAATLLFPPPAERGYTLLVDGTAAATADGFALTPAGAVLHRPAAHADGPVPGGEGACGHDCTPVGGAGEPG